MSRMSQGNNRGALGHIRPDEARLTVRNSSGSGGGEAAPNPWLSIPLADYEAHMAAPEVGQARLIGDVLERHLWECRPASLALLGCAGGNGLERISPDVTSLIVAIDINPSYVEETRRRFAGRFASLELHTGDLLDPRIDFGPVELVYAALVLEYIDLASLLSRARRWLRNTGRLATLIQLPSLTLAAVTPTPFQSLRALSPILRHVDPAELLAAAERAGFASESSERVISSGGKTFEAHVFRPHD